MYPASTKFCPNCGAPLSGGVRFCEHCGQAIPGTSQPGVREPIQPIPPPVVPEEPVYQQPPQVFSAPPQPPQPAYPGVQPRYDYPPAQPPAKKGMSCWGIALGIGCLGVLCLVAMIVLGVYVVQQQYGSFEKFLEQEGFVETQPTVLETTAPLAVIKTPTRSLGNVLPTAPIEVQPTQGENPFAQKTPEQPTAIPVGQERSDTLVTDDFSSNQFDWDESGDEISENGFLDGAYYIRILEPEYLSWAFVPVDFSATQIEFDFWVSEGSVDGAVGVVCFYEDNDNFYYIEVDAGAGRFGFRRYIFNEYEYLGDEEWFSTTALNPTELNHVVFECQPDLLSVTMNGVQGGSFAIDPPATESSFALLASTGIQTGPAGYTVYFDNFSAVR
jgi:hypothetical protein